MNASKRAPTTTKNTAPMGCLVVGGRNFADPPATGPSFACSPVSHQQSALVVVENFLGTASVSRNLGGEGLSIRRKTAISHIASYYCSRPDLFPPCLRGKKMFHSPPRNRQTLSMQIPNDVRINFVGTGHVSGNLGGEGWSIRRKTALRDIASCYFSRREFSSTMAPSNKTM
jgi:hypothetical protein